MKGTSHRSNITDLPSHPSTPSFHMHTWFVCVCVCVCFFILHQVEIHLNKWYRDTFIFYTPLLYINYILWKTWLITTKKFNIYCNTFCLPWPSSGNAQCKTLGGLIATVGLGNRSDISMLHWKWDFTVVHVCNIFYIAKICIGLHKLYKKCESSWNPTFRVIMRFHFCFQDVQMQLTF
jgi:hypothetical protein